MRQIWRWTVRILGPTVTFLGFLLPRILRLAFWVIERLLGGMATWFRNIPLTCGEIAVEWEREAMRAGFGTMSRGVYFFMWGLAFIEIILVTIILAHILVLFIWVILL